MLAPVVLLLVSNATAQGTPLPRNTVIPPATWDAAITEGKQKSQVMAILDHLCNRIGPRLTSSDNLQNACEWSREWLKDLGYDNARLDRWGEFPVGFNRGPWSGEVLAPIKKALVCNTPAWSAGTHGRQEGPLVLAPTSEEDAKERATELQGAWLLMKQRPRRSLSGRARRITKACQEAGALGYVYSGRKTRNGMKKGIVHENLLLTGGNYRIRWNKLPAFPRVQVRWDQFQELVAMLEKRQEVRLAFDIRNWFKKGPIPLYNVVADLVGSEKPNEFVVVSGHIDSWDGAAGTTDNGTGTATTLEAARILKAIGARPKRTIRFMLWSGEEQGLMGSRSWVQKNRKDVKVNCQAALVHDGGTNYAGGIVGTKAQLPLLLRAFAGFHTIDSSLPFQVTEGRQPSYGSDHTSFISIGAPGFYWKQEGNAQYRYTHHTQYDTFDAAVPAYQAQTAL
ncbi:MAG: hypothetical protein CMJ85_12320, partial [Planctomycetes bacterium]|nr:hypothetical protein [Planctomycetota bacterium]